MTQRRRKTSSPQVRRPSHHRPGRSMTNSSSFERRQTCNTLNVPDGECQSAGGTVEPTVHRTDVYWARVPDRAHRSRHLHPIFFATSAVAAAAVKRRRRRASFVRFSDRRQTRAVIARGSKCVIRPPSDGAHFQRRCRNPGGDVLINT